MESDTNYFFLTLMHWDKGQAYYASFIKNPRINSKRIQHFSYFLGALVNTLEEH